MSSAIFSTVKTITPIVRKLPASNHKNSVVAGLHAVVVRDTGPYSARNSSKGALIDEASRVFVALARGQSVETVRDQVLRGTLLIQRSRENRKRI
jgi:hypothetical protein